MNEDMKRVLEELEKDLLDEEMVEEDLLADMPRTLTKTVNPEDEIDAILADFLASEDENSEEGEAAVPAFEDPDMPNISSEPVAYYNYQNDYGNEEFIDDCEVEDVKKTKKSKKAKEDKQQIILMGIACGLCVAIIGVMLYWVEAFLK